MNADMIKNAVLSVIVAGCVALFTWVWTTRAEMARMEVQVENLRTQMEKQWQRSADRVTYHEIITIRTELEHRLDTLEQKQAYAEGVRQGREDK